MRKQLKKAIGNIKLRVSRALDLPSAPFGGILMLHRIDSPDNHALWVNDSLKVSPQTLTNMITYGRENGCTFVSVDDVVRIIKKKEKVRKVIAITLDDGYRDNYENGLPIFNKMEVPFCINITTDVIDAKMFCWWYVLEDVLQKNNSVSLSDGNTFQCSTKEEKEQAFIQIRKMLMTMPQDGMQKRFRELFHGYEINEAIGKDFGMTWDQVRKLVDNKYATLGNHTISHSAYKAYSIDEALNETQTAQRIIRDNIHQEMQHFAFPFGSHSKEQIKPLASLGFDTIMMVKPGFVTFNTDLHELPRFGVDERNWKSIIDTIINYC